MRIRNLVVVGLLAMPLTALAAEDPAVAALSHRLMVLQADMATADVASFEKLQAQQAIAALAIGVLCSLLIPSSAWLKQSSDHIDQKVKADAAAAAKAGV